MADVVLKNINKSFGAHRVIDSLDLEIRNGEFVTLLGPSGCGKSTLLRMVAGLESIDSGDLFIGGKRHNHIPPQNRRIAMVFQSYALFPHLSVRSNVLFGLKIKKVPFKVCEEKLSWVVPLLGLEGLERRLPKELSGGQRQRVALARALVLDPDVLLLDEPLSNLDAALRETAMEELKRVHRQVGKTVIYVTHNQVEAMTMSERIALLNDSHLEQYDKPRVVYDAPRTVFASQFIGSPAINLLPGAIARQDEETGVQTALGFLMLDRERSCKLQGMVGRSVQVGIRPQNMAYVEHLQSRRASDTCVELTAELVEILGDRSLIVARGRGETQLRFLITREADIQQDQKVSVLVDGRRVLLFDPETQVNIGYAP
jgi:multiple sugar transport system ATP-binding protein